MIDATQDVLREIGQLLRDTRHGRGEDAYDIAEYLRIRPAYLFALEQGDLGIMPGRPYAMGFLRTYADYLGLDGEDLVQRVRRAGSVAVANPELSYRTPEPDGKKPAKLLIAASIVGACFLYGSWYLSYSGVVPLVDRMAALPAAVGEMAANILADDPAAPPSAAAIVAAEASRLAERSLQPGLVPPQTLDEMRLAAPDVGSARPAAVSLPRSSDGTSALAADSVPANARQTASSTVGSAGELLASLESGGSPLGAGGPGRIFGAIDEGGRVVLAARGSSWIQIRSTSRDYVRTRTLEPGDRFVLPNRTDLSLWSGNAGGLEVILDGRNLGLLGAAGDVVRQLSLAPQDLISRRMTVQR